MLTAAARPAKPTLVYDGDCAFCRRWIERLRRWDPHGEIAVVPLQQTDRVAAFRIPHAALEEAMHLILPDGRVFAGAAATPEILRRLRGRRWLAWAFAVPGVPWVAARVYRWVARRRHRLGCGSAVCRRGE